jgi:hypothetical protein
MTAALSAMELACHCPMGPVSDLDHEREIGNARCIAFPFL